MNLLKNMVTIAVAIVLLAMAVYFKQPLIAIAIVALHFIPSLKLGQTTKMDNQSAVVVGLLIVVFGGLIPVISGYMPEAPAASTYITTLDSVQPGQQANAILKLNVKDQDAGTYAGSGIIYALKSGIISDRNDLMKKVAEGDTALLAPNSMTLASGVYSFNGFSGRVGDVITYAGYLDATPAVAENVSFVKTVTLTGITGGSTPEWMTSDAQYVWYNYPTLLFYNQGTAVTVYKDTEAAAIEKSLSFDVYPSIDGEQYIDSYLWLEAPEANIAAMKDFEITAPDGTKVSYGMPQEVTSVENMFRAKPALTTSTDKMYLVGKLPVDSVRTSTTEKAKYSITATYDHPASNNVLVYFKITSNTNALTTAGGHIDTPSTNLQLNMTDGGSDGWT